MVLLLVEYDVQQLISADRCEEEVITDSGGFWPCACGLQWDTTVLQGTTVFGPADLRVHCPSMITGHCYHCQESRTRNSSRKQVQRSRQHQAHHYCNSTNKGSSSSSTTGSNHSHSNVLRKDFHASRHNNDPGPWAVFLQLCFLLYLCTLALVVNQPCSTLTPAPPFCACRKPSGNFQHRAGTRVCCLCVAIPGWEHGGLGRTLALVPKMLILLSLTSSPYILLVQGLHNR